MKNAPLHAADIVVVGVAVACVAGLFFFLVFTGMNW
jgi:hypothetical protein